MWARTLPQEDKFQPLVLKLDPVRRCQSSSPLAMNMVWEPWEPCAQRVGPLLISLAQVVYVLISSSRHPWEKLRPGLRRVFNRFPGMWNSCNIYWVHGTTPKDNEFSLFCVWLYGFQDGQTIRRAEFPLGPLLGCMEVDEPHFLSKIH